MNISGWMKSLVVAVGGGLILLFALLCVIAMIDVDKPPLLADPAPPSGPQYVCVRGNAAGPSLDSSAPSQVASGTAGNSPSSSGSNGAGKAPATTAPSAGVSGSARPTSSATSSSATAGNSPVLTLECPDGKLERTEQARGQYDPTARQMALLGILAPLVTTIVGFLFGARAGAGEAKAETAQLQATQAKIETEVNLADAQGDNATTLLQNLRAKGLIK